MASQLKENKTAEQILRKYWHISFDDPMNKEAVKDTIKAMQEYALQSIPVEVANQLRSEAFEAGLRRGIYTEGKETKVWKGLEPPDKQTFLSSFITKKP